MDLDNEALAEHFARFKTKLLGDENDGASQETKNPMMARMRNVLVTADEAALDLELKYAFYGFVSSTKFSHAEVRDQERLLDFRHPSEWYPKARAMQRTIHVHVGPTNSGKTYHALKRLEEVETGCYAGPLRLLAHEVFERLNARGQTCNLSTGDDRRQSEEHQLGQKTMLSCTVEMLPLSSNDFEVVVIDEIQMLGSEDRGWAWTQALLGVAAKEVHVCGEERTVPILEELAAACGDKIQIHRYERLSPLEMMPNSLQGNIRNLKKGDCVVGFSIAVLHSLRNLIEQTTNKKCAIIYGTLPPETRAAQAKLFNDPNNDYDYLVASNAVGMGLNLSIRRLVFQSAYRNIKGRFEPLDASDIKQIAGRAGRYSTASEDVKQAQDENPPANAALVIPSPDAALSHQPMGPKPATEPPQAVDPPTKPKKQPGLVTTLEAADYPIVSRAMTHMPDPIPTAGLFPPARIIERFASYFPASTPFSYLLLQLRDLAKLNPRTHLCVFRSHIAVADALESVTDLRLADRFTFCLAPVDPRKKGEPELIRAYARLVASARGATVLDIPELDLELLEDEPAVADGEPAPPRRADRDYLQQLERLHKGLITFMWLSYKIPGIFLERELALHVKGLVEARIEATLARMAEVDEKVGSRRSRESAVRELLRSTTTGDGMGAAEGPRGGYGEALDGRDGGAGRDLGEGDIADRKRATPATAGKQTPLAPDVKVADARAAATA